VFHSLRIFAAKIAAKKEQIGIIATGHSAKLVEEWLFDTFLYGSVSVALQGYYGFIWGNLATFLVMTPLSALVCWLYMKFYDWSKQDWFGFEAIKEAKESSDMHWLLKKLVDLGDIGAFIGLSIFKDPFMVMIFLRKAENAYNGLTARDWKIFGASILLSNGYWTLRWGVFSYLVLTVWKYFSN